MRKALRFPQYGCHRFRHFCFWKRYQSDNFGKFSEVWHLSLSLKCLHFQRLPDKLGQQYEAYSSLVKRPKKLREREKADDQIRAVIPWIDASLKQLAGMRDMLPDFLSGDLINFEKRRKIWDVFYTWQQFQVRVVSLGSLRFQHSFSRTKRQVLSPLPKFNPIYVEFKLWM